MHRKFSWRSNTCIRRESYIET